MEQDLEELQCVDLGDAKDLTRGIHTMFLSEDNLSMIYREEP